MQKIIQGRIWKFGDNIDSDQIALTAYSHHPLEEVKSHALERLRPEFAKQVKPGDILVTGQNFGCGSSRELASIVVKSLGVGAVVADSFARAFFRNSIAIGLPIITCPNVTKNFNDGEILKLDLEKFEVTNLNSNKILPAEPLPAEMLEVLANGGIIPLLKALMAKG